jgi:hypothetical protein
MSASVVATTGAEASRAADDWKARKDADAERYAENPTPAGV